MQVVKELLVVCGISLLVGTTVNADTTKLQTTKPIVVSQANAQTMCPEVEIPVCATKNGKRVRYGNDCKAKRDGATDINPGECAAEK
jgi:hypothetical protein